MAIPMTFVFQFPVPKWTKRETRQRAGCDYRHKRAVTGHSAAPLLLDEPPRATPPGSRAQSWRSLAREASTESSALNAPSKSRALCHCLFPSSRAPVEWRQ
ncbi:hypothetical protein DPEC_G00344650 [Dallia pectoralis]|uniref:Uncharacterized protein n=1 Tax=Dallia pectoralis TaxID=75939 RepID=A0ACC2F390_DALPE|nr:hypothetical protein DPEC_G00344650 [Dallia pectoralis]